MCDRTEIGLFHWCDEARKEWITLALIGPKRTAEQESRLDHLNAKHRQIVRVNGRILARVEG